MPVQISKKRKFVQDGVFKAELNEFLTRELAEDGYSGVEVSDGSVVLDHVLRLSRLSVAAMLELTRSLSLASLPSAS